MNFNILYLNADPKLCAQEHTDEQVRTMGYEYAMLLSYIYLNRWDDQKILSKIYNTYDCDPNLYHWAMHSVENYAYLLTLWKELLLEHEFRFDKTHVSKEMKEFFDVCPVKIKSKYAIGKTTKFTIPPYCIPLEFLVTHNKKPVNMQSLSPPVSTLNSYRHWMDETQIWPVSYTKRDMPTWSKWKVQPEAIPMPNRQRANGFAIFDAATQYTPRRRT